MMRQLKKFKIKRATLVLVLLSGLAMLLPMPTLATQSVTFGWESSADTNVVGYNIYYGTVSHVYTTQVSLGGVTTATVSGLVEGTTYYFAATTYNALNQESAFSDEISYTVPVITTIQPPAITGILTTNTAIAGQNVTFTVTATGTGPLNYQWMYNSNNIATATNAVLTLNNVTTAQAGAYYVTVSNSAGSTNSTMANLTVYPTAAATLTPASNINGQFALNISGVPNCQYVVEASTNLVDWVAVQTNAAPFMFVDSNASQFKQRFYRTYYLPNYLPINSVSDITNGLVAWYPLAGDINDHSGNGNNGTAVGNPGYTTGANGVANTALSFNGSSQYISIADAPSLDFGTGAFSYSAWIQRSETGVRNDIYSNKTISSGDNDFTVFVDSSDKLNLYTHGTTNAVQVVGSTSIATSWVMISATRDSSGNLAIYINGVLDGTASGSAQNITSTDAKAMGENVSGVYFLNGAMAGTRIYNRELSPAEIGTLYTNGVSGGVF